VVCCRVANTRMASHARPMAMADRIVLPYTAIYCHTAILPYCHTYTYKHSDVADRTALPYCHMAVGGWGVHGFYSDIHRDHPEYALWCCELLDPSQPLLDFQKYVFKREAAAASETVPEEQQPAAKRARGPPDREQSTPTTSMDCKVCFDRQIDVLFIPCRHLVCCATCAALSKTCPVCRGHVSETLRVFAG
jgi:hypothetical protein